MLPNPCWEGALGARASASWACYHVRLAAPGCLPGMLMGLHAPLRPAPLDRVILLLSKQLQYHRSTTPYVFKNLGVSLVRSDGMVAVRYGWDGELLGVSELAVSTSCEFLSRSCREMTCREEKDWRAGAGEGRYYYDFIDSRIRAPRLPCPSTPVSCFRTNSFCHLFPRPRLTLTQGIFGYGPLLPDAADGTRFGHWRRRGGLRVFPLKPPLPGTTWHE